MADERERTTGVGEAALERALEDDQDLLLVYQPIHRLEDRSIVSAEALLRQRRQTGELREASIITETAEEKPGRDLYVLDSLLVRRAYEDAAQWHSRHPEVRLNVNISPREFTSGKVLERLQLVVGQCRVNPERVNVEITETSYIKHPDETVGVLNELKRRGFHLWLDDFGTQFSSMTHLQHFPLDGLKVPGSFVSGLPDDKRCRAIVLSLVALAHDLGMEVVAEEAENESQMEILGQAGCDYVQGFLLSCPMPLEEFEKLLDRESGTDSPPAHKDRAADRGPASRSS